MLSLKGYKFNFWVQEIRENVDFFVIVLHSLAKTCEYGYKRWTDSRSHSNRNSRYFWKATADEYLNIGKSVRSCSSMGSTGQIGKENKTRNWWRRCRGRIFQRGKYPRKENSKDKDTLGRTNVWQMQISQSYTRQKVPSVEFAEFYMYLCKCKKEGHWGRMCQKIKRNTTYRMKTTTRKQALRTLYWRREQFGTRTKI